MDQIEWKKWRQKGLGSSDSAAIMGVSPYKTAFQLWEEKTGLVKEEDKPNWAMQRGTNMEPVARSHYELLYNLDMPATLMEHHEYPFLRASLDGYNADAKRILEIKCPGKVDHQTALDAKVPEKYWPQVQHQLLVSGADVCHYYSFDGERGALVIVEPDKDYILDLAQAEIEFWAMVQTQTPPKLSDRDYKKIKDPEIEAALEDYKLISWQIQDLEKRQAELKKLVIESMTHPNMTSGQVRISKCYRKGSVDYSKIPQLEGIDLEPFRKPISTYYAINLEKRK